MPYLKKTNRKNVDVKAIAENARKDINPSLYGQLQNCQPTSAAAKWSFSMLKKILVKDRNFLPHNIEKYAILRYNKLN